MINNIKKLIKSKKSKVFTFLNFKKEETQKKEHYLLIGELCVRFSNLEQQIKYLLRQFGTDSKYDFLSCEKLANAFQKILKSQTIESELRKEINNFLEEFKDLSKKRNKVLKCSYNFSAVETQVVNLNVPSIISFEKGQKILKRNIFTPFNSAEVRKVIDKIDTMSVKAKNIHHKLTFGRLLEKNFFSKEDN